MFQELLNFLDPAFVKVAFKTTLFASPDSSSKTRIFFDSLNVNFGWAKKIDDQITNRIKFNCFILKKFFLSFSYSVPNLKIIGDLR
jgi:hypothetical protein